MQETLLSTNVTKSQCETKRILKGLPEYKRALHIIFLSIYFTNCIMPNKTERTEFLLFRYAMRSTFVSLFLSNKGTYSFFRPYHNSNLNRHELYKSLKMNSKTVIVRQQDTSTVCNSTVSAPLNPVPIAEQFRWSHPLSEHNN